MILLAALVGYATYLPATQAQLAPGMRAGSVSAALMTGIAHGCVPHAAGMEQDVSGLEAKAHAPDRLLQPADGVTPSNWGKASYAKVPTKLGEVWVARFENGNCLVRGWGDQLSALRAAVKGQFEHDGSPWEDTGMGRYTLTIDTGPRKDMVIEARATGETVDRPEIQADEVIFFTLKPAG